MTMLGNLFTVNGDDNNNFAPCRQRIIQVSRRVQVNRLGQDVSERPSRAYPRPRHPSDGQQSGIANDIPSHRSVGRRP